MRYVWFVFLYCYIVYNERYKIIVVDLEFGIVNDFKEKCFSFGFKNLWGFYIYIVDNCIIWCIFISYK